MKKWLIIPCLFAAFIGCKKVEDPSATADSSVSYQRTEIDRFIFKQLREKEVFEWSMAPTSMVWSAIEHTDHILSIGYRLDGAQDIDHRLHEIIIQDPAWVRVKEMLLLEILRMEQAKNPTLTMTDIIPWEESVLPVINVIVRNKASFDWLVKQPQVRYAEPMSYEPADLSITKAPVPNPEQAVSSSSGCGSNNAEPGLVNNVHYTIITPTTKQSWNHTYHNISKAWSKATGRGIKLFIIDTGVEFDQENLGTAFNQGASTGRTVEKIVTLPRETFLGIPVGSAETPDDGCGHGTSMAGAAAAPRGTDGNTCGVAYNSNLVTCRAAVDVYLDESREIKGASDAFTNAANRTDVRIISMSMGKMTSSSQLRDAIRYAYGKSKLIFCAAGTSFSWTSGWYGVIFPAWMPEVNAVTGVKDNNFNTTCGSCHSGSETDFTVVMERAADNENPLSLAMTGDAPSTVGGSSVATATAAGIAALVWSKFPTFTRDQVLNKLITTSARYPVRSSSLGWGNLNADAATN